MNKEEIKCFIAGFYLSTEGGFYAALDKAEEKLKELHEAELNTPKWLREEYKNKVSLEEVTITQACFLGAYCVKAYYYRSQTEVETNWCAIDWDNADKYEIE